MKLKDMKKEVQTRKNQSKADIKSAMSKIKISDKNLSKKGCK